MSEQCVEAPPTPPKPQPEVKYSNLSSLHQEGTVRAVNHLAKLTGKHVELVYNPNRTSHVNLYYENEHKDWLIALHNYSPTEVYTTELGTVVIGDQTYQLRVIIPDMTQAPETREVVAFGEQGIGLVFPERNRVYSLFAGYDLLPEVQEKLLMHLYTAAAKILKKYKPTVSSSPITYVRELLASTPRINEAKAQKELDINRRDYEYQKGMLKRLDNKIKSINADIEANKDPTTIARANEASLKLYTKLLKTKYEKINFLNKDMVVAQTVNMFTSVVDSKASDEAQILGKFKVTITPKNVWFTNQSKPRLGDYNGPHLDLGNGHCFGNVEKEVYDLIGRRLYVEALLLISEYLGTTDPGTRKITGYYKE